jgi:folate-dependent tRNA-U54 methylase TrmFO/GidA
MASGLVADSFAAIDSQKSDDNESSMNDLGALANTITIKRPSSFSLFPKLPVELRLKIWRYAPFEQRNVDIVS